MSGPEIREKINENNIKIQRALNKFILTDEINELMKENADLRALCRHEFNDKGFCVYCNMPIDFKED